jgi:nucleoid-associated protein EbfC
MDMKSLMRQAQEMQKKMQKIQEELAETDYEGAAGGDMVKVVINGTGLVKKISIDPSLVGNKDEKEILEDLLVVAFNDAKKKSDDSSSSSLRAATSGIPLPPGFQF